MSSTDVFVFELASCVNIDLSPGIVVEGLGMFSTLMRDFGSAFSFVRPGILEGVSNSYHPQSWRVEEVNVGLERSYGLFEEFCERSDRVLAIAPEDDMMLCKFTEIADRYSNLGSDSKAVRVCSDKWEVYRRLKNRIDMPETSLKPLHKKQVVKPRVSCGGSGIVFYSGERHPEHSGNTIYQEFIDGVSLSVSMIAGDDISVLSVNEQILDGFEYLGAIIPARVDESVRREVIDAATEAAGALGLRGYCGVDIVYSDRPYVVDVNARMTTPSIVFFHTYGINLGELILENYERGRVEMKEGARARRVLLKKGGRGSRLVSFKGAWISLSEF